MERLKNKAETMELTRKEMVYIMDVLYNQCFDRPGDTVRSEAREIWNKLTAGLDLRAPSVLLSTESTETVSAAFT